MVVTFFPAMLETGVPQERTGWPSRWTVHAPQSCIPQPNLVPVMPSVSRKRPQHGSAGVGIDRWSPAVDVERAHGRSVLCRVACVALDELVSG